MTFVAIPQATCAWLLGHTDVIAALHDALMSSDIYALRDSEFSQSGLRVAGTVDGKLVAVWNREYLTGTGEENWGIFKLSGRMGLNSEPDISQQVFERTLFVINQRLQGFVLDGELIHRSWPNGAHTCLAGRGSETRKLSIAYFEAAPGYGGLNSKAMISIGPGHDFDELQDVLAEATPSLVQSVRRANELVDHKRRRPLLDSPSFMKLRDSLAPSPSAHRSLADVTMTATYHSSDGEYAPYETMHWSYEKWIQSSALNEVQRRILESDPLDHHPVRVIGPAGSGKTLLMQLLAMRYLERARQADETLDILYIVHNAPMAQMVSDRFRALGAEEFLTSPRQKLRITTLSEFGRGVIGVSESLVIDKDAQKTKEFQLSQVRQSLKDALGADQAGVAKVPLLAQVATSETLLEIFALLVMAEISSTIKGRGLVDDEARYVGAEVPLSRFHGILDRGARRLVFDCFRRYNDAIFEQFELLDSDDVALSLLGRLRTPIWKLKRRSEGSDFVFVDEAQLFNENEKRIFPYLTKGLRTHVPIALALDEAQEPFGFSTAGLAALGITDIESESLPSNHRSTKEIVDLAFFIIQKTTDLFSTEFPEFQNIEVGVSPSQRAIAAPPMIAECNESARSYGRYLVKLVQKLRANNIRQIAVIVHAEAYWLEVAPEFLASQLPLHVLSQRGEKLSPNEPLVVLTRPSFVGGQEFDAVVLVGLEHGLVPPRIVDNVALAAAIEQQTLRELYLAITRARVRVIVALNEGAQPTEVLEEAERLGLISRGIV